MISCPPLLLPLCIPCATTVQISAEKLLTRKTALALRVINPNRATNAVTGIWQVTTGEQHSWGDYMSAYLCVTLTNAVAGI